MTREELFRAVGEVREDQIEAAEIVKKQIHPWPSNNIIHIITSAFISKFLFCIITCISCNNNKMYLIRPNFIN